MMFRPTVLLLTISMVFLGLLSTVFSAPTPEVTDLAALGQQFQELRKIQGHWEGGEFNAAVDGFNGEKHQVMQKLQEALGENGVASAEVLSTMGPSDEIPAEILKQLKRTAPQITPPTNFVYLLYKWRGYHDYVWFRINQKTNKVHSSAWYFAYE
ncbi:hypothetical protein BGZ94_007930 [Podila epigama]|nr:hypothetical protein BGZ94_007930 [Podila epigama]